jgi:hypothetical protein
MRRIREVLRLKFELKLSDSRVALGARIARSTVQDYLHRIAASGLDHEQLLALDECVCCGRHIRKGRRTAISTPSSCGTSGSGNRLRARR